MLANIAQPLLGLVDTALMGHMGSTADLAALAVGTLILNFIYWNFGFLRMSTTALVAQAAGSNNQLLIWQTLLRASGVALIAGAFIILIHSAIIQFSLTLISAPDDTHNTSASYLGIRLWGAPISLLNYVITGYLIGTGRTHSLLKLQILLNVSNALFNVILAGAFKMGVAGIALGTLLAECLLLIVSLRLLWNTFHSSADKPSTICLFSHLLSWKKTTQLLKSNRDIWIRTLFLLLSFLAFTHWSTDFGATTLAANHILLQLISFSAFFLDGYAHVTEAYIGQALGSKQKAHLIHTIKRSTILAGITAIALSSSFYIADTAIIKSLTSLPDVVETAHHLFIYAVIYITCSFAAFQCDGIFIGANAGAALRNSSIAATLVFISLWLLFLQEHGVKGLWIAFIGYVIARAIFLGLHLPKLLRYL